jgi:hypothetical protein
MMEGFLSLQSCGELLAEFRNLGADDELAVTLKGISSKIFLMIGFRFIPLASRCDLGDNRGIVQLLVNQSFDQRFGRMALCWSAIENR